MGFWTEAISSAGEAYSANQRAEAERASAERERQRNLATGQNRTWLFLGIGGSIVVIILAIWLVIKK